MSWTPFCVLNPLSIFEDLSTVEWKNNFSEHLWALETFFMKIPLFLFADLIKRTLCENWNWFSAYFNAFLASFTASKTCCLCAIPKLKFHYRVVMFRWKYIAPVFISLKLFLLFFSLIKTNLALFVSTTFFYWKVNQNEKVKREEKRILLYQTTKRFSFRQTQT